MIQMKNDMEVMQKEFVSYLENMMKIEYTSKFKMIVWSKAWNSQMKR
jgi:hypothetical protein